MRKVTLKDLAVALGVARSTVSRALRDDPQIAAATRERVRRLAGELGYHPNAAARALTHRRSEVLGLLLPRSSRFVFANPYFNELLQGICEVAEAAGYPLLISTALEPDYGSWLREGRVDGLIVLGSSVHERDVPLLDELVSAGFPLVAIHAPPAALSAITVSSDEAGGIRKALTYLAETGHQRIAFLAGPPTSRYARERERAYRSALQALGFEPDEALCVWGADTRESGAEQLRELLARGKAFDAVLCNNDLVAIGACTALRDAGLRVPDDVSVVGFDDIELAALVQPALTTIRQPVQAIGETAMRALLALLGGRTVRSQQLPTELIRRESTAPRTRSPAGGAPRSGRTSAAPSHRGAAGGSGG